MTNWTPTEGLRRAEPALQELLQAAAAVGKHITDPVQRYKFTEILARHLDRALADGSAAQRNAPDLPDFAPSHDGDEHNRANGHHEYDDSLWSEVGPMPTVAILPESLAAAIEEKQRRMDAATTYQPIVQDPSVVSKEFVTEQPASAPVKRGRGRPKGSTGKKKKAARARARAAQEPKPAAEAPPAEVPES